MTDKEIARRIRTYLNEIGYPWFGMNFIAFDQTWFELHRRGELPYDKDISLAKAKRIYSLLFEGE